MFFLAHCGSNHFSQSSKNNLSLYIKKTHESLPGCPPRIPAHQFKARPVDTCPVFLKRNIHVFYVLGFCFNRNISLSAQPETKRPRSSLPMVISKTRVHRLLQPWQPKPSMAFQEVEWDESSWRIYVSSSIVVSSYDPSSPLERYLIHWIIAFNNLLNSAR